jgi:hypothetical protein
MPDNDLCETPQPTQQSVLNRSSKDKFLLVLNLPLLLRKQTKTNSNISMTPLQISVRGTVVPAIRVPANEVRFAGQAYNVSSHARPNYEPLTVNFIVDNKFLNYWNLWYWLNSLNTARGSTYTGSNNRGLTIDEKAEQGNLLEYQSNLSIFSLNEYNQRTVEFIYYNAFITELGSINYNYEDSNIIETTATFQFSQLDMKITPNL